MSATGGNLDLAGKAAGGRKLIAVVYADMVGYSRLIGLDDAGTLRRLRTLRRALIDPAIREYGGRVAQTGGDSLLVAFDSIDGAVRCAVKVQQQVPVYDRDQPTDRRIRFRIGINIGDVIPEGTNLHGDGVNIAARLEAECPVGGICVSRTVRDHVHGRLDLQFEAIGLLTLKNIARPVEAFVVRLDPAAQEPTTGEAQAVPRPRSRVALFAGLAGLLLVGAGGTGWWLYRGTGSVQPATQVSPISTPATTQAYTPPNVGVSTVPPLSMVVLPFENLGGNPKEDYLTDGITEDVTTDLTRVPGMFVIARKSAYAYKGKAFDVRKVGKELGVRYAVEGSARKVGNTLRVNAQLVSTDTGLHVWADRFDIDPEAGAMQSDVIAAQLATTLGTQVIQEASAQTRSNNPDASDLILRARSLLTQPASMQREEAARVLFEHALQLDPSSGYAMARLANVLISLRLDRGYWLDGSELERAAKLVAAAQALMPDSDATLAATGFLYEVKGNYREAITTAERLTNLNPNSFYGFLLAARSKGAVGEAEQAISLLAKAMQLNPRDPYIFDRYWRMGAAMLATGRYEEAITWTERAQAAWPDAPARNRSSRYLVIAAAYALNGQADNARRAASEASGLWPFWTIRRWAPEDPTSDARAAQVKQFQEGQRLAGVRDHADEDADFGVPQDDELRADLAGYTPTTVPGAQTIRTFELAHLLPELKPIVLDCAGPSWGQSIPGAISLLDSGVGGGLSDGNSGSLACEDEAVDQWRIVLTHRRGRVELRKV